MLSSIGKQSRGIRGVSPENKLSETGLCLLYSVRALRYCKCSH